MRTTTLTLCLGLLATSLMAAPLKWHTDYGDAYRQAEQNEKFLLVSFHDEEKSFTPSAEMRKALEPFVLLKVATSATITVDAEQKPLLDCACFRPLKNQPGLAVINLKYRDEKYTRVVASLSLDEAQRSAVRVLQFLEEPERELGPALVKDEFGLSWHTVYGAAYSEAKQANKLLMLAFDSDNRRFVPGKSLVPLLRGCVLVRLRVEDSRELLSHPGLRQFHGDAGIGVIDLKNEGTSYGRVVNVLPAEYLTNKGTEAMLKLAQGKTDLPKLGWLTDYHQAREQAERQQRMLLIAIDSDDEVFSPKSQSIPTLHGYVLLRQKIDTEYRDKDDSRLLVQFADFQPLCQKPGLVVYDFRSKDAPHYGQVVGVMPYKYLGSNPGNRVFSEEEREREFLALEPNSLTRRILTWAIRVSKGHGRTTRLRSADGRPNSRLMSWALKNSQLQCRYGCGHHAGGPMRSEIASTGPGDDIVEGALNMVSIWRSSRPHYATMVRYHREFGYDMAPSSSHHWYGTGRF